MSSVVKGSQPALLLISINDYGENMTCAMLLEWAGGRRRMDQNRYLGPNSSVTSTRNAFAIRRMVSSVGLATPRSS